MESIQITLKDNIKKVKIPLSTVSMYLFSARDLEDFLDFEESSESAVYFLFNEQSDNNSSLYIGESENIGERLKQHKKGLAKGFWTGTVVLQSHECNKGHYKALEHLFHDRALYAGRNNIINKVTPSNCSLSDFDSGKVDRFFNEGLQLLFHMRLFFFEHPFLGNTSENDNIYYIYHSGGTGKLIVISESNFLLKKGSIVKTTEHNEQLVRENKKTVNIENTKLFETIEDLKFDSDSEAAFFVTGDEYIDWTAWRNTRGEKIGNRR